MHKLRSNCPWDREQTHASLLKYLKEESLEVEKAVKKKDWDNLKEELGDVLLQILFHSEIASEKGRFDVHDVIALLKHKLIRRHPHVFDKKNHKDIQTADDVRKRWKEIKAKEKASRP